MDDFGFSILDFGLADVALVSGCASLSFIISAFLPQIASLDARCNERRADQSKIQNRKSKIARCSPVGLRLSKSGSLADINLSRLRNAWYTLASNKETTLWRLT